LFGAGTFMSIIEAKAKIELLLERAEGLIPAEQISDLPPMDQAPGVPGWHSFELELWRIGEEIRQIMNSATGLRKDEAIYSRLIRIAADQKAKRGRQSFVLLFCYRPCASWASSIADLIADPDVAGHAILALYKMKARGYSDMIKPLAYAKMTWISKEANRDLDFDEEHRTTA
jgi:hypothetical protein